MPYSWVLSFEIFLTRCFRPCPDEIIGYYRTRPRAGGLSKGETARRRTQHNEAPFESDATNSTKGAIIVSEKDNRLFRLTLPPSFSGDSNVRLVVLCTLVFLVSFWLLRSFSPAALLPFRKKPFISSDHGTREPPCLPLHATPATFGFLCRPFAVSVLSVFSTNNQQRVSNRKRGFFRFTPPRTPLGQQRRMRTENEK